MTANVLANSSAAHSALPCRRCYQQPRPVAARPKTRLKVSASAFGALSSDSFGGPSTGSILSQAASVVGIAAAAWFAARYADTSVRPRSYYATCQGIPSLVTRWR